MRCTVGVTYVTIVLNQHCNMQLDLLYIVNITGVTQNVTGVTHNDTLVKLVYFRYNNNNNKLIK